jgi:hypothetical protein
MKHFAGLDVSVKETSICIVKDKVVSEPALDPQWPIREADIPKLPPHVRLRPTTEVNGFSPPEPVEAFRSSL